ncbi:MAG: serine/threonine protein kinase [Candidatus Riflebacteria bacterium]|nr:serine/threonine protein kinase [Candidatus Riflebacteria bacterium]
METTQVSITATGADGEARFDVLSLPPEFLGRFRIVRQLGSGACGTVYLAEERAAGGAVAIKFLIRPERIEHLKRFVAEGQILSRVRHPNVLAVREVCEVGDHPCIVAEYLEGGSLRERLRRVGRLPPAEAARVAVQCLSGLQALHDQGIVHRDVKPENILMNAAGVAKIADLGIAKEYGLMASRSLPEGLIGTPLYMSPEQTRADPAGVPSDVYAMGLVLYEMLSGSHPFQAQTLGQILEKQRKVPAPDLLTVVPGIPGALAVAVNASLAKAVHRRRPASLRGRPP